MSTTKVADPRGTSTEGQSSANSRSSASPLLSPPLARRQFTRGHHPRLRQAEQLRRVSDVMTSPVTTIAESTSIADVARLMDARGVKRLPVLQDSTLWSASSVVLTSSTASPTTGRLKSPEVTMQFEPALPPASETRRSSLGAISQAIFFFFCCVLGSVTYVPCTRARGWGSGRRLICMGPGEGERAQLHLPGGVSVWLCAAHRSAGFHPAGGEGSGVSLMGAWEAAGCMTRARHRALDAHRARWPGLRPGGGPARTPGRGSGARRSGGSRRGEAPAAGDRGAPRPAPRGPADGRPRGARSLRWFREGRWLPGGPAGAGAARAGAVRRRPDVRTVLRDGRRRCSARPPC